MTKLGSEVVTIITAPLLDDDPYREGDYRDWENATEVEIQNCNVQPFPMAEKLNFEDNRDREFNRTAFRFYVPPETVVDNHCRVRWRGLELEVFGQPGPWVRFSGLHHHTSFIARLREG